MTANISLPHFGSGAGGYDGIFKRHFVVTGVDLSLGMLNKARIPHPDIEYADYDDLEFLSRRGLAQRATGQQAISILRRLSDLSASYGAELEVSGSKATLEIGPGN